MSHDAVRILALSGSLRPNSSTNALVRAATTLAPIGAEIHVFQDLAGIPAFDDRDDVPRAVENFRAMLAEADGIFICTPEYAFGVPGALKNALDWTVSSGEFVSKPVALVTAATDGKHAHAALLLTLQALSANVVTGGTFHIPFIRTKLNAHGEVADSVVLRELATVINALADAAKHEK